MSAPNTAAKVNKRHSVAENLKLFATAEDQQTSDDYYTPPEFFEQLGMRFNLDVASPAGGCHWIPADNYYDQQSDGLTSDWYGTVFMNPPFSHTALWGRKFVEHGCGVAIVPISRAHWFNALWADASVKLAIPRQDKSLFTFVKEGKRVGVFMPIIVAAMGDQSIDAISRIGFVR